MKVGSIDIKKAYFGTKELTNRNAFIGTVPLIGKVENAYVTFTAEENNSVLGLAKRSANQTTLQYSTDGINWDDLNTGVTITLNSGGTAYVRGKLTDNNNYTSTGYTQFKTTNGTFSISGNINTIWNYEDLDQPLYQCCGYKMFNGCTGIVDISEFELPSTALTAACYAYMFENCDALKATNDLPASKLANMSYNRMFYGCTSLIKAPEISATTLDEDCCSLMFYGCTSLTAAPNILPATTLAMYCYQQMFNGCTSLTTTPELPATTLANRCYMAMFGGCTSLTTAPELPTTTLNYSYNCYYSMFSNCTNLTTAPMLPATILIEACYSSMFSKCTNLSYIKCLATNISASRCTENWVKDVSPSGTFVKSPEATGWTIGINGIPEGWTIVNDGESEMVDLGIPSGNQS